MRAKSVAREVSVRSQSPQAGQFNSYSIIRISNRFGLEWSQSPQAGQFNSYLVQLS